MLIDGPSTFIFEVTVVTLQSFDAVTSMQEGHPTRNNLTPSAHYMFMLLWTIGSEDGPFPIGAPLQPSLYL